MSLIPGTTLGPYEIQSPLGAGGMGEVYKATDTRLDRTVAIKVLLAHVADDPDLRQRFEREAKTISSLNHPHICTLYDIGQQDGIDYLVMEYLEGETLAARLTKGPLPTDQVLRYATEIADALDKAHRKGITHRDLKPGNIMITKAGTKLLDFGLAKLRDPTTAGLSLSQRPTQTASLTGEGKILGTLQYMAPEQLEGKEADHRTDIFAFGALVYEMATGKKAFEGKSQASLIGAILKDEPPPISTLQPLTPPILDQIVKTCLAKDPDDRWRSAGDVGRQMAWIGDGALQMGETTPTGTTVRPGGWRRVAPLGLGALVTGSVITGVMVWALTRPGPAPPGPVTRSLLTPSQTGPVFVRTDVNVALTPDGAQLVYRGEIDGEPRLFVRSLSAMDATPLTGPGLQPRHPFISPDGDWVGFWDGNGFTLNRVSIEGGPPVPIVEIPVDSLRGASWGPDDTIIFATKDTATGLLRVPAGGGEPEVLTRPNPDRGEVDHWWPEVLPGGDAVLFTIYMSGQLTKVAVLTLENGETRELLTGGINPRYIPSGHIVYGVDGTLRAVGFDLDRLQVTTDPVPVVDRVAIGLRGGVNFSVASNGSLVYVGGGSRTEVGGFSLVWVDRDGREEPLGTEIDLYSSPRLSPDGTRVVFAKRAGTNVGDIFIHDIVRNRSAPLTFTGTELSPIWTPDGQRVVFQSRRDGAPNLYWQAADGTGEAERLTESSETHVPWSIHGQTLVFGAEREVQTLSLNTDPSARSVRRTGVFVRSRLALSPDGRWLAYQSAEDGGGIDVRPFPDVQGGRWRVASEGQVPVWSPDGRELFYYSGTAVMSVPVTTDPSFGFGNPETVFEGRYTMGTGGAGFSVSPDGRRFLMVKPSGTRADDTAAPPEVVLVLNWFEELKARVPTDR